jgi:two-component sensor histidine kinase
VARRADTSLQALVRDDGEGLPDGFSSESGGLGMQIVQSLVSGDMRGRISWSRLPEGGTEVSVDVNLQPLPGAGLATDPTPALIL